VAQNISFARIATQRGPVLNLARERAEGRDYIKALRIRTPSPNELIVNLSGGNQQKAILARWLARGVDLFVLDNPTRGVDAGAKEEIYDLIRGLTDDGVAILLISDDLLEVIGLSNRIVVMKDGVPVGEIPAPVEAKPHETDLVSAMV
jgi:ribose transport system ATP-binding protein